ncbi:uncharacterized protein LOC111330595 [Stylophora pistillata]|nr:uncharacterized protein LOC111330595 [Stylophora pistillata]XP_022791208.1 uncharacterized protein LOC111330595 [Stylophora pistillata]XP_022791209.1 uncharacterized protein LOC111330595 [Stylophora pistillata]XP_022791210.1 uncharacterized protein LOC111330595 [Stylophora pistillata]XP_022791211.1 uncharacterized protein LOC111330595 [Stylophora pistillata]
MQPQQKEGEHPFPSPTRKNEGPLLLCDVKKENSPKKETCINSSSSFNPSVKRSLTDSEHDMVPYHLKRFKQTKEDSASSENGGGISLSSKASLQQIVSEVARSLQRNNSVPAASFRRKKTFACGDSDGTSLHSVGIMDLQRQEKVFGSSPRLAMNAVQGKLDALPFSASCRGEKISKPQVKAAHPVLRTLNCRGSSINEGVAIDHDFFPKLVGVHSISSSSAFSPQKGAAGRFNQDFGSPLPKELSQKAITGDCLPVENAGNFKIGTLKYDSETDSDLVSPVSPNNNESEAFPLSQSNQNQSSDESLSRKDSKCHSQDKPRALPIIPLVLTTSIAPLVSTSPFMDANPPGGREKAKWPRQTSKQVAEISTAKSLSSCSPEDRDASVLAHTRHRPRKRKMAKNTETCSAPSHVSSTFMYSNRRNPRESPKNITSVNKQEFVDINRMAACGPPRKRYRRSSFPSKKPYDLLFNFTKPNGKSDLFLVVKDKVFAVERFDCEGESYLIHTNQKGKTAVLAKLPKVERLKLQINDRRGIRPEQQMVSGQLGTLQHPAKTSLSVSALNDSFYPEDARDTASSISSHQLDSDTIYRVIREKNIQGREQSLNNNSAVLSRGAPVRNDGRMKSDRHRSTMSLENRRLLLKQVLYGLRKEISNPKETLSVGKRSLLESAETRAKDRGIYVFSDTHSTPRCASSLYNRKRNQQSIVNPDNFDRYQESDAVYHRQQYSKSEVESSARETHTVGIGQQSFFENQPAREATYENFACGNTMPPCKRGTLHRRDSINHITHPCDSNERVLSTSGSVNILSRTSANDVINVAKIGASSRMYMYEKSPHIRQFRQLSELLLGDSYGKCSNNADPLAGNRAVESFRVAQAPLTPSEIEPVLLRIPNGGLNNDPKFTKKRPNPDTIGQQGAVLADTCHLLKQDRGRSKAIQQLLNGRNEIFQLHSNQTGHVGNALSTDFLQGRECSRHNTSTASEQNVLGHIASEGAAQKTPPPLEWQPMHALVRFQQRYLGDASRRGTTDVVNSREVVRPLDAERITAGDEGWESMELQRQRAAKHITDIPVNEGQGRSGNTQQIDSGAVPESSMPYNCYGLHDLDETEDPFEKNPRNDLTLRLQQEKESPPTFRQRVVKKGEWKKKCSCSPESKPKKNMSNVPDPDTAGVIVIDDD